MAQHGAATEFPLFTPTYEAATDLSSKQYYFVKESAAGKVTVCTLATDVPIGVLQNAPTAGQTARVMTLGVSKVSSDAALTLGQLIGTSGDGQADAKTPGTDTTEYVCGRVTRASGAAGGIAMALINCLNPHRAA